MTDHASFGFGDDAAFVAAELDAARKLVARVCVAEERR